MRVVLTQRVALLLDRLLLLCQRLCHLLPYMEFRKLSHVRHMLRLRKWSAFPSNRGIQKLASLS